MQVQLKLYILKEEPAFGQAANTARKPQPKLMDAGVPLVVSNIDNAKRAATAEILRRGFQVRSLAFSDKRTLIAVVVKRQNRPAYKPVRESDLARQS